MSVDNPAPEAYAYTVSMVDGEIGISAKEGSTLPAWPVRGTSSGPAAVWRSGQTQSWAAGDDGYWERGAVWPSPRFVVQGDCVVDNLTRLVWSKDADLGPGRVGWQAALTAANDLWACGHGDWRLPNAVELRSLVDYSQTDLASWLEAQGFVDVQQDASAPYYPYWSSTTREYQTNAAYGVRLDAATEWAFMKEPVHGGLGSVWAVSGGEPTIFADGFDTGNMNAWSSTIR